MWKKLAAVTLGGAALLSFVGSCDLDSASLFLYPDGGHHGGGYYDDEFYLDVFVDDGYYCDGFFCDDYYYY